MSRYKAFTKQGIPINSWLDCGCCGNPFQVWPEYIDQDQDHGYGTCAACQEWIEEDYERPLMDDCIAKVAAALRPANREKFLGFSRENQEAFVHKAMDRGWLKWSIGGGA